MFLKFIFCVPVVRHSVSFAETMSSFGSFTYFFKVYLLWFNSEAKNWGGFSALNFVLSLPIWRQATKSAEAKVLFFYLTGIIVLTTVEELLGQIADQNVDICFLRLGKTICLLLQKRNRKLPKYSRNKCYYFCLIWYKEAYSKFCMKGKRKNTMSITFIENVICILSPVQ